ncbi:hypothetical protein KC364_g34 [Hortaea werneckii]|nr:hypothetical protein KC364_g34 [Hortaea werneckii]
MILTTTHRWLVPCSRSNAKSYWKVLFALCSSKGTWHNISPQRLRRLQRARTRSRSMFDSQPVSLPPDSCC